jgi:carboxymethylenebutenolidase
MGFIQVKASDGHQFQAYSCEAKGESKGSILLIQEIFGVNSHIQSVCDRYADFGYQVLAPALFDRVETDLELGYTNGDVARGREIRGQLGWDDALLDLEASLTHLPQPTISIGYCWGGSLSWLCATRLGVNASVCYYGGQISDFIDETPGCPVLMHFGETDDSIPMDNVARIRATHPQAIVHTYPAGHGFNCEQRGSFHPESADLALKRTLGFIQPLA